MVAKHASDCAMHNAPAYQPDECDCGVVEAEQAYESLIEAKQEGTTILAELKKELGLLN